MENSNPKTKSMTKAKTSVLLQKTYFEDDNYLEIGVDEAGRGPMLGRVYSGAVILPKNNTFHYELMKDSKKFTSKKKLHDMAQYIKKNALYWHVGYETEEIIDKINIRNATYSSMHTAIKGITKKYSTQKEGDGVDKQIGDIFYLLIDGNDFKPFIYFDNNTMQSIPHTCITGGDNKYCAIAAASILAKVARDQYIEELCNNDETLIERYDLLNNKGYGTKKHMDGIKNFGITKYHRKTFGICKNYT